MNRKKPWPVYVLLLLLIFLGISGGGGGIALIVKPDGSIMQMPVSVLKGSFFTDFLIPGIILFLILGIFPLLTFLIMMIEPDWKLMQSLSIYQDRYVGWMFSLFAGFGLIIWMNIEIAIIGFGAIIQVIYSILGLLLLIFTLIPSVMKHYERRT